MDETLKAVVNSVICFGIAYLVYRDAKKDDVKYANMWIVCTALFPPIGFVYFIYKKTAGRKVELTKQQLLDIEIMRRTKEHTKKVAVEREALAEAQMTERQKNRMVIDELEQFQAERLALKAKKLRELEEERLLQQEEIAKKLRLSADAASNMRIQE